MTRHYIMVHGVLLASAVALRSCFDAATGLHAAQAAPVVLPLVQCELALVLV